MSLFIYLYFVELFLSQGISAFIREQAIVMRKQVYVAISQHTRTAHLCRACTGHLPSAMALGPLHSPKRGGGTVTLPLLQMRLVTWLLGGGAAIWTQVVFLQSSCSY